eukprot:symbB.v1.2.020152.t1/scaffold1642.1/size107908/11
MNSKHVPAVLSKLQQLRPCSFVLDSGEGRLCPFYVFDAVRRESLNSWQQAVSTCARDLTRRQKTQEDKLPQQDSRRSSKSSVVQLQEDETSGFDRPELIDAVFRLLDVKRENALHSSEVQEFAMFTGFDGNDEEWREQYQELCSDFGWEAASGISREQFEDLIGDEKETTDEELRQILASHSRHARSQSLQSKDSRRSSRSSKRWSRQSSVVQLQEDEIAGFDRPELIDAVFRMLDVKKENVLRSSEVQEFAMFTGFDGNDEEWQEQYQVFGLNSFICGDSGHGGLISTDKLKIID